MRMSTKTTTYRPIRKLKEQAFRIEAESDLFRDSTGHSVVLRVIKNRPGFIDAIIEFSINLDADILTETDQTKDQWESMIREALIKASDLGVVRATARVGTKPAWFIKLLEGSGLKRGAWPYYYVDLNQPEEKGE